MNETYGIRIKLDGAVFMEITSDGSGDVLLIYYCHTTEVWRKTLLAYDGGQEALGQLNRIKDWLNSSVTQTDK